MGNFLTSVASLRAVSHHRALNTVSIAMLTFTLAACGIGRSDGGLFCSTACPDPGDARDSFCGCNKKITQTPTRPGNGNGSASFVADCICDNRQGNYTAWLFDNLTSKPWTIGKRVTVTANTCKWVNACSADPTDDGGTQYHTVTGTVAIDVTNTGADANYGGNYISGRALSSHAFIPDGGNKFYSEYGMFTAPEQNFSSPLSNYYESEFASKLVSNDVTKLSRFDAEGISASVLKTTFHRTDSIADVLTNQYPILEIAQSTASPIISCEALCDPKSPTPFCTSLILGGTPKTAFSQLFQMAHDEGVATYPQSLLLSIFDVANDPCERSETTIINGKLRNTGGGCLVTTSSTIGAKTFSASLDFPTTLSGDIAGGPDTETVDFPNGDTALTLSFSDPSFDASFGGKLRRFTARKDRILWQTDKQKCIAIGLQ